jgi:hypothetical protein
MLPLMISVLEKDNQKDSGGVNKQDGVKNK